MSWIVKYDKERNGITVENNQLGINTFTNVSSIRQDKLKNVLKSDEDLYNFFYHYVLPIIRPEKGGSTVSNKTIHTTMLKVLSRRGMKYIPPSTMKNAFTAPPPSSSSLSQRSSSSYSSPSTSYVKNSFVEKYKSHNYNDPNLPNYSIFTKEEESARTMLFLAPSGSGKTTLLVRELNKLVSNNKHIEYLKIFFFTNSINAAPLKHLSKELTDTGKLMMFDRFVPAILDMITQINTVTHNRFNFLIILDDILEVRGALLNKCVCVLRNSNISTVISLQHFTFLTPKQRSSVNKIYAIHLTQPQWEFFLSNFIEGEIRSWLEALGDVNARQYSKKELGLIMEERTRDRIFYLNQMYNEFEIFKKPPPLSNT